MTALEPMALPQQRAWVKVLGKRYLTAFERALLDPRLVSMRQELALLDARIADMKERAQHGESRGRWSQVSAFVRQIVAVKDDAGAVDDLCSRLGGLASAGEDDFAIWDEIKDLIERRRRIADTERKYEEKEELLIPMTHLTLLFANIHESIEATISDRRLQRALLVELRARCNGDRTSKQMLVPLALPPSYLAEDVADGVDAEALVGDEDDAVAEQ